MTDDAPEQWYYDLAAGRAVPSHQRGPDRDVLGPFPTKEAAEGWQATRDAREKAWEEEEERWSGDGGGEGGVGSPA